LHAFLHTWCIDRSLGGSFTSQTVLRSFIQIYFFRTVSIRCCEIKINTYNDRTFDAVKMMWLIITWCVTRFIRSVFDTKTVLRRIIQSYFFRRIRSRCWKIALLYCCIGKLRISICIFYIPGVSTGFSAGPLPLKLYCGPLSKFTFSGLYVPGAICNEKICIFILNY